MAKGEKKTCQKCGNGKALLNYYSSNSPLHSSDKKVPYCKICLKDMVNLDNIESVYDTLRAIDKPFIKDVWSKAQESNNHPFGEYMRMICSLPQYRDLVYKDSIYEDVESVKQEKKKSSSDIREIEDEIEVSKELKIKWGHGYSNREYMLLEDFYQKMLYSYDISTPTHKKQLELMCKMQLKMDKCLEDDNIRDFNQLHGAYEKLLQSSGFRPIDRKSTDEATGLKSFSQIFEFVENKGFIKPYPLEEDQDIVDRTLQYYVNHVRRLMNMEQLAEPPEDTPKVGDDHGDL